MNRQSVSIAVLLPVLARSEVKIELKVISAEIAKKSQTMSRVSRIFKFTVVSEKSSPLKRRVKDKSSQAVFWIKIV